MGNKARRFVSLVLVVGLFFQQAGLAQAVGALSLAGYLNLSGSSALSQDRFRPVQMRYFSYEPASDNFKILLDKGDINKLEDKEAKEEAQTLLSYFLVGVSLPDDAFWVNLRPDSQDQIIDPLLEKTEVGRIMLEADLQLKKDTSRMTSPQTPEGKAYWDKLYKKAGELFGTENITIPTITRPWIVPGEIIVRESQNSAYVYKAGLKVMLEEDYLTSRGGSRTAPTHQPYAFPDSRLKELNQYSTQLIKELIIPKLTKEINSSKRYASLRQVYYSLILSRWFKLRFSGKSGTYASLINTRNLTNLTSQNPWYKGEYFNQYQQSFAKGEYNLKEQIYTPTGQSARSYVSGGENWIGINAENGVVLKGDVSNTPGMTEISGSANSPLGTDLQTSVAGSPVKARVENKLKELKNNSGLPILTTLDNMPEGAHDNALWAQTLRVLHFSEPVYRRVEKEGKAEERYTGQPAFTNADADADIKQLTVYDVSAKELYSIRKGEDVRGFILNPHANIPPEAYFMHRGIFASKADIQKAFYDNKIRFDITIVPPAIWGVDFAKTVGHYHDPVEKPEIYQVVSGEVLWLLQKTDEKGNVVDFITVRAKAGDIAIMLPGYGHVSVNLSDTEPLVMADWLTWHQSSYYGSFKDKKGAAYYVIKNNQGQPELIPNRAYLTKTQGILPQPRQMVSKDGIPAFGLKRGVPIYKIVNLGNQEFKQKVEFLNQPEKFLDILTPEETLDDANPKENIRVSSPLGMYEARYQELLEMSKDYKFKDVIETSGMKQITTMELDETGFKKVFQAIDFIVAELEKAVPMPFLESPLEKFVRQLIAILEELAHLEIWVNASIKYADHHSYGYDIPGPDERHDLAGPVRAKAQEALNNITIQKAIRLVRLDVSSAVKNSAHNLPVSSYGNINKGIVGEIFSEVDELKIFKWIETVGLPVKTIILSPQDWGFDPDSDHWLEGSIMIDLVFEGVDAALRIGEHSFRMFGSSGRNGEWPQETNFDDIVRTLYYDTRTGPGSAESISIIFDPLTRQNEIWQFKANFGELTEETIRYMTDIKPDKLGKNNIDDTFSLIQTSAFLTSGQKNELLDLLNGLYGKASSYFQEEKSAKENPVYHHTQVLYNMARIALGEKCEYSELKKLLVLALLHDIGNAICVNQKWTNDQIITAFDEANKPENSTQKEELLRRAIEIAKKGMAFRLEHMEKGPELIEKIIREYVDRGMLTENDIKSIKEAVRKHDYPSVEKNLDGLRKNGIVTDEQVGAFLLPFEDPVIGRLVEFLREADRLFMLSVQGVIKDIKDNNRKKRKEGGAEIAINLQSVSVQGKKNIKSHKEEYNLYQKAGKDDGKFINNESLYRTKTGYEIFKDAKKRFNSSSSLMQSLPEKKTGGIDWRALPMSIQPMGSFRELDFGLPRLSLQEIERIDVQSQIGQIKSMVSSGISPSGRRVKELVAACAQKGQISAYADDLLACIGDILKLEEEIAKESSPELKEALVIAEWV